MRLLLRGLECETIARQRDGEGQVQPEKSAKSANLRDLVLYNCAVFNFLIRSYISYLNFIYRTKPNTFRKYTSTDHNL
jgi:hypothetical protein